MPYDDAGAVEEREADEIIRSVVAGPRRPAPGNRAIVCARAAAAPLATRSVHVPPALRGVEYAGYCLGSMERSDVLHLVKRVVIDGQWENGTTVRSLLEDLHSLLAGDDVRVAVYQDMGRTVALFHGANRIPAAHCGAERQDYCAVVYDADPWYNPDRIPGGKSLYSTRPGECGMATLAQLASEESIGSLSTRTPSGADITLGR